MLLAQEKVMSCMKALPVECTKHENIEVIQKTSTEMEDLCKHSDML